MTGAIGRLLHCSGDASASKTCNLPLGVGHLTFEAMKFPIAPGTVPVDVDIALSSALPTMLAKTKTVAKATAKNGDDLFCMEIDSAAAEGFKQDEEKKPENHSGVPLVQGKELALTWNDCGGASAKTKITGFSPTSISLGQKTKMIGKGDLSEEVTGATFDLTMTGAIGRLLHCSGDASASKTCNLPLGVGHLTFEAMKFPIAPGTVPVDVDIALSSALPTMLAKTKTVAKATAKNGDDLFCMEIDSAAAAGFEQLAIVV